MPTPADRLPIDRTLRRAAAALRDAQIPFLLGGGLACWTRGGPRVENDVDLMVTRGDADRALATLAAAGMRTEHPPEDWLLKAYDGDVGVDLIFAPLGVDITHDLIAAADELQVLALGMRVMSVEDVLVSRLLAMSEQRLDFTMHVQIARALREQVDWSRLASRVDASPYARAFLQLLRDLRVTPAETDGTMAGREPRVRRIGQH